MPTLTSVTNHFIAGKEGFTTTTSGSVASGATTVGLNSVSGYTNGDSVAFVIDPTDANKKQVFTGTIDTSGVQVTDVVWTEGTNQTHSAGATVVDYTTATHQAALVKGLLVSLDQDGTLKNASITNAKLATTANEPGGAWASWTPTWGGITLGNGTNSGNYKVVGKTLTLRAYFIFGTTSAITGSIAITPPLPMVSHGSSTTVGHAQFVDVSTGKAYNGTAYHITSPSVVGIQAWAASGNYVEWVPLSSTVPFTWTTGDSVSVQMTVELA